MTTENVYVVGGSVIEVGGEALATPAIPFLQITTTSPLPSGTQGIPYTTTIAATGGTAPYSWSFYAAPAQINTYNIALSTGVVTGTPSTPETDFLYVQVTDSSPTTQQARVAFTLVINSASAGQYVGMNVVANSTSYPQYYDSQFVFLNILKGSGGNGLIPSTGNSIFGAVRSQTWQTLASNYITHTNEEAYLSLNSNGYPVSMTAVGTPPGGQQFTVLMTSVYSNLGLATGASGFYPMGASKQYYLYFNGGGSMNFHSSDVVSLSTSTAGVTVSGTTITSTLTASQTGLVTVNCKTPTSAGFSLAITATNGPTNYLQNMAMVQAEYQSNYLAGQVIHPLFLSWMNTLNISSMRFMGITNINNDLFGGASGSFGVIGNITSGQNTGTIGSQIWANNYGVINAGSQSCTLVSAWTGSNGVVSASFSDGETRNITLTNGQTTCTWTGGLTNQVTANIWIPVAGANWGLPSGTYTAWTQGQTTPIQISMTAGSNVVTFVTPPSAAAAPYLYVQNWTAGTRPTSNTFTYSSGQGGMSLEYQVAICNAVNNGAGCDFHLNMPVWGQSDYWTDALTLTYNGGGSTLPGQTGLKAGKNLYIEVGNELWNSTFNVNFHFVIDMGNAMWPGVSGSGASWRGMIPCLISDTAAGVYGSSAINNTVRPLVAGQYSWGGGLDLGGCLKAPAWTVSNPPWSRKVNNAGSGPYSIWGWTIAPYAGPGGPAPLIAADYTELLRQSDGGVAMLNASLTQNPVPDPLQGSGTWSMSCTNFTTGATQPLPAGGWTQYTLQQIQANASEVATIIGSTRTMGAQFYECGQGFGSSGTQEAFLQTFSFSAACGNWLENSVYPMYAANSTTFNIWNWCSANTGGNNFGLIQSGMQQQTGASAPAMWAGTLAYSES